MRWLIFSFILLLPIVVKAEEKPFQSYTGKVTKNKVRMRLQPNLDSPIVRELDKNELVIVVGKTEDFYAIEPPPYIKAYVYRTYVLDDVVEGHHVNVRLEPHLQAPIIAQLNTGDRVDGAISPLNSKWLEISSPSTTRFYIANEYIEKAGDAAYMATRERRREEVNQLLSNTYQISQTEMQKTFPEIFLDGIYKNYHKVINEYPEFTEQVGRAKELLVMLQDTYLHKKIAYLESKAKNSSKAWKNKEKQLTAEIQTQKTLTNDLEHQLQNRNYPTTTDLDYFTEWSWEHNPLELSGKMALWLTTEKTHYEKWLDENDDRSIDDYYEQQSQESIAIRGVVELYDRTLRNKPGDYVLIHRINRVPIAYLYSTQVDLQNYIGREITIYGSLRPNHNFAYPAYFVLWVE